MRLWSLHPKYLDTKGLLALWREALLAKNVLLDNTKGYKNHPQLARFKSSSDPLSAINQFLSEVFQEAEMRSYQFNREKIDWNYRVTSIPVTQGQINYEVKHLSTKLSFRDPKKFEELKNTKNFEINSLFNLVDGDVENWEKLK